MRLSPENILNNIRHVKDNIADTVGDVITNPNYVIPAAIVVLASSMNFWVPSLMDALTPNRLAENQEWSKKQAEEALKKKEDLRRDYLETGGVDMRRVGNTETFSFTISRPSAVLAESIQEILDGVTIKVARETGCQSVITTIAWQDTAPRMPWDAPKPTIYSATAGCQK